MKLSGSKVSKNHSTHIDVAKPLLTFANKNVNVTKISLGIIQTIQKVGQKSIKLSVESGCLLLKIRGVRSIQEIRLFTSDVEKLKIDLLPVLKKERFKIVT